MANKMRSRAFGLLLLWPLCGAYGVEPDESRPFPEMTRAADEGDAVVQRQLGMTYLQLEGEGQHAFYWLSKAAEQQEPEALTALGRLYQQGRIVGKDSNRAFQLFLQSAHQRELDGQLNTGAMYLSGTGTERDVEEAYAWFAVVLSHEREHVQAQKYQQLAVAKMGSQERAAAKRLAQTYIRQYAPLSTESTDRP